MAGSQTRFDGVRVRYDSEKSYEALLAALLDDIGDKPVPINTVATDTGNWQEYQERVEPQVGPSGFMLFSLINHGAWITKAGIDRKLMRVILGNPLIAITMLRHDVTAGLFAPVELLLTDEGDGRSSLTYVKPSSLMVIEPNHELRSAAEELDAKLAALAEKVTSAS
ncbi:DUF302 domain-containing protein [Mycobacterium parmense]|uniref:Uncharacterized protein n=1 Tax=Mycobacterium parmense TaxID=185642 RepID=A0A7I7YUZ4_9MYCO|nr:DUF302 domain-containing protein [Mycobacterium parmense]MCV7351042.1 DUF302 domain-containing protein [Mycobacterium parmense]ORW60616.1 hypothetical protein AWC20_06460 [Mycobacterium parmense]BBZ45519.1 hypothetical protein MPRM_28000 [Mycobacterium parmense]